MVNRYASLTDEEIDEQEQMVYDLRVEIKRLNASIGRMFEKGLISHDMIAEALDDKIDPDDIDSLRVIFSSWKENNDNIVIDDNMTVDLAVAHFVLILKTIRSYQ